jgi:hypothetical protein
MAGIEKVGLNSAALALKVKDLAFGLRELFLTASAGAAAVVAVEVVVEVEAEVVVAPGVAADDVVAAAAFAISFFSSSAFAAAAAAAAATAAVAAEGTNSCVGFSTDAASLVLSFSLSLAVCVAGPAVGLLAAETGADTTLAEVGIVLTTTEVSEDATPAPEPVAAEEAVVTAATVADVDSDFPETVVDLAATEAAAVVVEVAELSSRTFA